MANEFKIKKGLIVTGADGGTVVDIQGSQGQLFSVTDDLSGSIFAVSDISGVPILDVNSSGLSTFDGNVNLPDNKKILLGTGNDLEIYHDGSHSYINDAGTGALKILASQFEINNAANTENIATFTQDGAVSLFYNNVLKLATTSAGVTVAGAVTITDTAGTRGINRNNSGYNLDLMGGTNNTDGAYISLSGETRGGAANSYNGRIELYSGGSGLSARANVLGDIIFGTKWNGGAAQILILDSASGDAAFSNNVTASSVTATTFSGDLNGTINTVTTAVTKPNTTDDNTVATTAFVKNLIAELPAGLIYKGTWNADTNTPTLAAGGGEISEGTTTTVTADKLIDSAATFTTDGVAVGDRVRVENVNGVSYALVTSVDSQTQLTLDADIVVSTTEVYIIETPAFLEEGNYYIVSVDGATDLNGITDWKVGDWVVASSTNEWQKIDNSSVLDGQGTGQTIPLWSGSGDSNTLGDAPITVNGNDTTFAGNVIAEGSLITRSVNANVTISGDTSGNIYYNNASGEHRWRANGSSVNSMNLSSTLLTVNENATFTGTVTAADLLTVNGDGHLFLGADEETPKIDMMYDDHDSGAGWDTRIFTGKTDDLPNGQNFPTSTIAGGFGTQYQANSDGAFFGIIPYAEGHYRPIINWGDDVADTPFSFQFNGSDIVTINYVGDITAPIFDGDHKGTINTATTGFTQTAGNNSTLIATTAYADAAAAAAPIGVYLPLAGGTMAASANINMNSGTLSSVDSIDFGIGQLNGVSTSNLILKSLGDITYNVDSNNNGNSSHIFQESGSELMRIRYDGNVGIGTNTPSYKLEVEGPTDSEGFVNDEGGNKNRLLFPKGGSFNSGPTTGAITVKLPVLWTNTMLRITLRVFDYGQNESFDVTVAGYNYVGSGSGGGWVNTSAWISSQSDIDRNFSVRFGNDGTKSLFYIGELASSWSYLKVNIVDVELNHAATVADWSTTAWSISMETTAFANVSQTRTNCQVNNWKRNGQDVYYASGTGNVGIGTTSPVSHSPARKTLVVADTVNGANVEIWGNQAGGKSILQSVGGNTYIGNLANGTGSGTTYITSGAGNTYTTILANGNVGIGTTSPGAKLHVVGEQYFQLNTGTGESTTWKNGTSGGVIQLGFQINGADGMHHRAYMRVKTDGVAYGGQMQFLVREHSTAAQKEVMTLRASGNVGIGTTSPRDTLEIEGNMRFVEGEDHLMIKPNSNIHGADFIVGDGVAATDTPVMSLNGLYGGQVTIQTQGNTIADKTVLDVQGTQGQLFSVTDDLSGDIFSVADISGVPIMNVNSDGTSYFDGNVGIGVAAPSKKLEVAGSYKLGTNAYIEYGGVYPYTISTLNTAAVGNLIFTAGSGSSGYESGITLQGSNTAGDDAITFTAGSSTAMVIQVDGKVGIGTTNPETPLHILTNTTDNASTMLIQNGSTGDASIKFNISGDTYSIGIDNSDSDKFKLSYGAVGTNDRIIVNTSGWVGIDQTNPTNQLHVHTNNDNAYAIRIEGSTNNGAGVWTGLGIGGEATNSKSALLFEDIGVSYARGKLHLCVNNELNQNIATPADAKLTVSNNGNVGIGTTSPNTPLEVTGGISTTSSDFVIASTGERLLLQTAPSPYSYSKIQATSGGGTMISEVLALQPDGGGVAIGTTSSGADKLLVNGTINFNNNGDKGFVCNPGSGTFSLGDIDDVAGGVYMDGDGVNINYYAGTAVIGAIDEYGTLTVIGDIVAYGSPSDIRLKENIKPIESALDKVIKLQGVTFDWKESDSILDIKEDIGFIAQDVQKVVPELVRENDNGMLSMRHQGITPILLEAIKELKAEIDLLKSKTCNCNNCNCSI